MNVKSITLQQSTAPFLQHSDGAGIPQTEPSSSVGVVIIIITFVVIVIVVVIGGGGTIVIIAVAPFRQPRVRECALLEEGRGLAAALQREDTRLEASETLRGLIDAIVFQQSASQFRAVPVNCQRPGPPSGVATPCTFLGNR